MAVDHPDMILMDEVVAVVVMEEVVVVTEEAVMEAEEVVVEVEVEEAAINVESLATLRQIVEMGAVTGAIVAVAAGNREAIPEVGADRQDVGAEIDGFEQVFKRIPIQMNLVYLHLFFTHCSLS